jgi:predicted dithiol-disulfide oxidoreductase (DUF899 family)
MKYRETNAKLSEYRRQIADLRQQMRATRDASEPEEVRDYQFTTPEGTVSLSSLFGAKRDLIVIHNMGVSCPNCTLWADGFNGIYDHLTQRAAFVIASPDSPDVQREFARSRGWRFTMISHAGTTFAADMGYRSDKGTWLPGISVFTMDGGRILRVSDAPCDLGDDFCSLWHIFDLLPGGSGDFHAKIRYP